MRRSSEVTSDGQMDHGQVRKPRISRQKPVTWPDTAFGHLTGYAFVGRGGLLWHGPCCGTVSRPCHAMPTEDAGAWAGPGPVPPPGRGVTTWRAAAVRVALVPGGGAD